MKRIFVAAGMGIPKNKKIKKEAEILARKIAKSGATYAQGGCADGVMGYTLKEFIKHSNKAVFYLPIKYYNNDANKIKSRIKNRRCIINIIRFKNSIRIRSSRKTRTQSRGTLYRNRKRCNCFLWSRRF